MSCSVSKLLSAYHDGELDSAQSAEVERHITECPECTAELAELAGLSRIFEQSPPQRLSQIAMHRIHDRVDLAIRGNFLRTVKVLRAIAACVVVAGSIWLMQSSSNSNSQDTVEVAPPWLDAAVTATAETQALDATSPAAAWYVADFASRSDDVP